MTNAPVVAWAGWIELICGQASPDPIGRPNPGAIEPLDARRVFFRLGLTAQDGWTPPRDAKALPDAAKQWLKDNAEKYRIQRLVADKGEK